MNRLELSSSLWRCLVSTNVIENPHSAVRWRTRNVSRWRDGKMVLRWLASAFPDAEKTFRRIQGYRDLWMLEAALAEPTETKRDSRKEVAEHCWVSAAPKASTTNGTSQSQNHEILREKCFEEYLRTTEAFTFPSF